MAEQAGGWTATVGRFHGSGQASAGDRVTTAFVAQQIAPTAGPSNFSFCISAPREGASARNKRDTRVIAGSRCQDRLRIASDRKLAGNCTLVRPFCDPLLLIPA